MDYEDEQKRLLQEFKDAKKRETWSDLGNTVVVALMAAGLAWWAYGTVAHAALFAFMAYLISAVGNSVTAEIRATRLRMETRELGWRREEEIDADIDAGRHRRRADIIGSEALDSATG